jgi:hypothetical protein
MKNKTFQEAKELYDKQSALETYRNKLYMVRGICKYCKEVTINYTSGKFNTRAEVTLKREASDFIQEMVIKEIDRVTLDIDKLKEEFNNL